METPHEGNVNLPVRVKSENEVLMEGLVKSIENMTATRKAESDSEERVRIAEIGKDVKGLTIMFRLSAVVVVGFVGSMTLILTGKGELGTPILATLIGGVLGIFAGRATKR